MFAGALLPRHSRSPALLVSLALHIVLFTVLPVVEKGLRLLQADRLDASRYAVEPWRMRLPDRLYYFVEPPAAAPRPQRAALRKEPAPAARRSPAITLTKRVELPPLPAPPRVNSIVIQPNSRVLAELMAKLPAITAWAPREAPTPKKFVLPGIRQAPVERPNLNAPPVLDKPNREVRLSDLNMTGLASNVQPRLPRPPSSTTPVRVFELPKPGSEARGGGMGRAERDPANLITAGPPELQAGAYLSLPALGDKVASAGITAPPPEPAGTEAGNSGGSRNGSDSGSGSARQGSASPAGAQAIELTPARDTEPPLPATRIVRPKDGHYTFFVMGSRPEESFPETVGMLSGKLVYTVYLRIGARRDWILQYCLPKSAPTAAEGKGNAALEAPYPFLMLRPEVSFDSEEERLFVHGMISGAGKFEQLELVGEAVVANKELLLGTLRQWEFRPAARDGKPTPVEVLLIIPRPDQP